MLRSKDKNIIMVAGDYGTPLTVTLKKVDIQNGDVIKFRIKRSKYDDTIVLEQTYDKFTDLGDKNYSFDIIFTEDESKILVDKNYCYSLTHYRDGVLKDTITHCNLFTVERGV